MRDVSGGSTLRVVALGATIHHFEIALSDVDRGVYETVDLRVAQHPSETARRLYTRTLAYCLSHEEGIAFSKGGLSSTEEPPLTVRDPTGLLRLWIDIGAPSAERLHKASKAAKVAIYTWELEQLRRQVAGRTIHDVESIDVWPIDPRFLDEIAAKAQRRAQFELTRSDGALYLVIEGVTLESALVRTSLLSEG
jgi:uncharacterized protein YaeQ